MAKTKGNIDSIALCDVPVPDVQEHQLLIKVFAAGVNPVDWKAVDRGMFEFPYIVGTDVSGIVEKVGVNVKNFRVGDEVIGSLNWKTQGAFTAYVLTEEKYIVHKPKNKSHVASAAIPLASLTAWQALFDVDKMNLHAGQRVLIHAAAGGVGLFALQLAKWKGAYVIATSSPRNASFLKEVGADEVVDYNAPDAFSNYKNLDGVLDSISDEKTQEQSLNVLRKGGMYVSILGALPKDRLDHYQIKGSRFLFQSNSEQLNRIVELVETGFIDVYIEKTYSVENFKEALRHVQKGRTRGKVVLTF